MDDLAQRHAELVLVAGKLDAIVDHWHFFGEGVEPRITPRRAFHERRQLGTEQIEAGISDAPECTVTLRGPRDHEGRAERAFVLVRILVVEIVREVLRGDDAHIGLQVLVEQRRRPRREMRRQVFADKPA